MKAILIGEIESIEWIGEFDLFSHIFFNGINKPLSMLAFIDIDDMTIEILGVASSSFFDDFYHFLYFFGFLCVLRGVFMALFL
jgi:hypothetical protein